MERRFYSILKRMQVMHGRRFGILGCAATVVMLAGSCHDPGDRGRRQEEPAAGHRTKEAVRTDSTLRRSYRYEHLSREVHYMLHFDRTFRPGGRTDDRWLLAAYDAQTGALRDSFTQRCIMLFYDTVPAYGDVRSYVTGYNRDKEALDNDYGDLVVADLNFDGREDLALKTDVGGTSGNYYTFFLQDDSGRFRKNDFLTDSVASFPGTIDARRKRLITFGHAGVRYLGEHRYRYVPATQTYRHEQYLLHDLSK